MNTPRTSVHLIRDHIALATDDLAICLTGMVENERTDCYYSSRLPVLKTTLTGIRKIPGFNDGIVAQVRAEFLRAKDHNDLYFATYRANFNLARYRLTLGGGTFSFRGSNFRVTESMLKESVPKGWQFELPVFAEYRFEVWPDEDAKLTDFFSTDELQDPIGETELSLSDLRRLI